MLVTRDRTKNAKSIKMKKRKNISMGKSMSDKGEQKWR